LIAPSIRTRRDCASCPAVETSPTSSPSPHGWPPWVAPPPGGDRAGSADARPVPGRRSEPWVASLPREAVTGHAFHRLPADRPPWFDSGLDLEAGSRSRCSPTAACTCRSARHLGRPAFQLWSRVGERGPVFRGTRATNTFRAPERDGSGLRATSRASGPTRAPARQLARRLREVSGGSRCWRLRWSPQADVKDCSVDSPGTCASPSSCRRNQAAR